MRIDSLNPAPGERGPAAAGCVATGCLHGLASLAVMALGALFLGRDGQLIVLGFWLFLGLAQWAYVAPLALLARRFGQAGVAKGLWIGGLMAVGSNAAYWGANALLHLRYKAQFEAMKKFEAAHPIIHRNVNGPIVSLDATHVVVRTPEGEVSVVVYKGTEYIKLKSNGGYEIITQAFLKPGQEAVIDGSQSPGGPVSGSIVRVKVPEEGVNPSQ